MTAFSKKERRIGFCKAHLVVDGDDVEKNFCQLCDYTCGATDLVCCPKDLPFPPPSMLKKVPTVVKVLNAAAAIFEDRNETYGDGYLRTGALLLALFPEGGIPAITTPEEAMRLRLISMCAVKLQRYCFQFEEGGHPDSVDDLIVYAAMLKGETH